jgi:hypothetical protein
MALTAEGARGLRQAELADLLFGVDDAAHLLEEPGVDLAALVDLLVGEAEAHGLATCSMRSGVGVESAALMAFLSSPWPMPSTSISSSRSRPVSSERSAFCSDSWKVRPIAMASPTDFIAVVRVRIGAGEFLEGKARDLGDDIVDRRLEGGRRRAAGDVVLDLVERVADGERAATLAIGKPVALDASADERDTRGFISMTIMRPVSGLTANCTFEPPVSTPISRSTASEASRMIWYSLSVSVSAGATVMESPVWTPIGSMFSIEQMMMQLSFLSRTTSISYSFQPSTLSSISTSLVGEASMPRSTMSMNSSLL